MPRLLHLPRRLKKLASEAVQDARAYLEFDRAGNEVVRRTDFSHCHRPVLLLYGFMATRGTFAVLEERLRRDGFGVFSVNLGGLFDAFNTRDIALSAERVREKIERLYARYDLGPLTIVGHSKGGLIGRYYVQCLGGDARVRALITLGTPHRGTPNAYAGAALLGLVAPSVWQMTPLSPFLRRLREGPFPRSVRLVSVFSKADRVSPFPSCVLETQGQPHVFNEEVPDVGHRFFPLRRRVYDLVRRELFLAYRPREAALRETGR